MNTADIPILALDPSSSRTGYALMRTSGQLVEAGLFKPGKATDPATARIEVMGCELSLLLTAIVVACTVIEISSGKVGKRHGGGGAGLATYGMAVGYLWAVASRHGPVVCVPENLWTRGQEKKKRQAEIAMAFRQYKPATDPGGDIADAIGLGRYYLKEQQIRKPKGSR